MNSFDKLIRLCYRFEKLSKNNADCAIVYWISKLKDCVLVLELVLALVLDLDSDYTVNVKLILDYQYRLY